MGKYLKQGFVRALEWQLNREEISYSKWVDLMEEECIKNYKEETFKIIGAAMEVHRTLGCGFLEAVYQEALAIEFKKQNIPYKQEKKLEIQYKEQTLSKYYEADFMCYDKIIVETKAIKELSGIDEAQVINYLKATGLKIGLLINFGAESLEHKRLLRR